MYKFSQQWFNTVRGVIGTLVMVVLLLMVLMIVQRLDDKIVGKSPSGWHKIDMEAYMLELQRLNPGLKIPDVRNTFDRSEPESIISKPNEAQEIIEEQSIPLLQDRDGDMFQQGEK